MRKSMAQLRSPVRDFPPGLLVIAVLLVLVGAVSAPATELDRYGGWEDIRADATGYFHIERVNGRALLITPEGHGFVAIGVNHLHALATPGDDEPDIFRTRFAGDWKPASAYLERQLRVWGFNSVDSGGVPFRRAWPYFVGRNLVRTSKFYGPPGAKNPYDFPDVFDPAVVARLQREVAALGANHRNSKTLIAYFWTDTPTWDIHKSRKLRQTDWVSQIRALPASSPGKQHYVWFLRDQYGENIDRFNRAYALDVDSFTQLAHVNFQSVDVASSMDLEKYEVERDDQQFLGIIARRYYGVVGTALRDADPNHMVFGEKYLLGDIPPQVAAAAAPYVDAIAVQPGDGYLPIYTPGDVYPRREMESLHQLTNKPILICDHQISFATERYPQATWPYHQRPSERDAADAAAQFLQDAFAQSYVLGYMRCQYIDRYDRRRGAVKLGLVRDNGSPHEKVVTATTLAIAAAKQQVRHAVLDESIQSESSVP